MSAIRIPVPSPLFPAQTPPPPERASRTGFFRAVLDGPAAAADPAGVAPTGFAAPAAPPATAALARAAEDRPQRPGALLDIRV